ncbi:hypothetical protein D9M69_726500 [compost metagenome]
MQDVFGAEILLASQAGGEPGTAAAAGLALDERERLGADAERHRLSGRERNGERQRPAEEFEATAIRDRRRQQVDCRAADELRDLERGRLLIELRGRAELQHRA